MVSIMTPVSAAPSYLGTILGTQPFICVQKNAPNSFRNPVQKYCFFVGHKRTLVPFFCPVCIFFAKSAIFFVFFVLERRADYSL